MENNELLIKNDSIYQFLKNVVGINERQIDNTMTYHNFFKDEIIIPKKSIDSSFKFINILMDDDNRAGWKLTNKYYYTINEYDSISYKLILAKFNVELKETV